MRAEAQVLTAGREGDIDLRLSYTASCRSDTASNGSLYLSRHANPHTITYKHSHSYKMGCVSLFEFSEPLEQIASQYLNWQGWFGGQSHIRGKASVWFQIDREAVRGAVKTVQETREEWAANGYAQYIPFVEVGHRGPLPIRAITRALVISRLDRNRFRLIESGPEWQTRTGAYAATLPEPPPPSEFELAFMEASEKAKRPPG